MSQTQRPIRIKDLINQQDVDDKPFHLRDEKIRILEKELIRVQIETKDKICLLTGHEFLLLERDELLAWKGEILQALKYKVNGCKI